MQGTMPALTRRELLPLLSSLAQNGSSESFRYDLVIKGGQLIDPSQALSARSDIAVAGNKVVRVSADISPSDARLLLDARGKIVTPGLIDIHVHVYDGVAPLG